MGQGARGAQARRTGTHGPVRRRHRCVCAEAAFAFRELCLGGCVGGVLRGQRGPPRYSRSPTHRPFLEEGSDALSVFRFAAEIAAPKDEVPGRPVSPGPCVCNFRGGPSRGLCVHIHTLLRHLVPASVCIQVSQELSFVLCSILALLELSVP